MEDPYFIEWSRYYEQELLTLWELLGCTCRNLTTPDEFRDWVYRYSQHDGNFPPSGIAYDVDEREYNDDEHLISLLEEKYVNMYHYCEQMYLPLLHHHGEALSSLLDLCFLCNTVED